MNRLVHPTQNIANVVLPGGRSAAGAAGRRGQWLRAREARRGLRKAGNAGVLIVLPFFFLIAFFLFG